MTELLVQMIKAVYRCERQLDRLLCREGVEVGHCAMVEKIARRYGQTPEERLLIMETLAGYRGED